MHFLVRNKQGGDPVQMLHFLSQLMSDTNILLETREFSESGLNCQDRVQAIGSFQCVLLLDSTYQLNTEF